MATHSSVLAWRILGTEEPGGLLSMGSQRVEHDWSDLAAAASILAGENPIDRGDYSPRISRVGLDCLAEHSTQSIYLMMNQKWQEMLASIHLGNWIIKFISEPKHSMSQEP